MTVPIRVIKALLFELDELKLKMTTNKLNRFTTAFINLTNAYTQNKYNIAIYNWTKCCECTCELC